MKTTETMSNSTGGYIWPQCFITGQLPDKGDSTEYVYKLLLLANAFEGWALASLEKAPEQFGMGMARIGRYLGVAATPDSLLKLKDELMPEHHD